MAYLLNLPQEAQPQGGFDKDLLLENIQRRQQEKRRQQKIKDLIFEKLLSGQGQLEGGFNPNEYVQSGKLPDLSTYQPAPGQNTSGSYTTSMEPYPMADQIEAAGILGTTPESLSADPENKQFVQETITPGGNAGKMAGGGIGGILGGVIGGLKKGGGWKSKLLGAVLGAGTGAAAGGKLFNQPKRNYEFTPEFESIRGRAGKMIKSPYKTKTSIRGKFSGRPTSQDTDTLMQEFLSTKDPTRARELEAILESRGAFD